MGDIIDWPLNPEIPDSVEDGQVSAYLGQYENGELVICLEQVVRGENGFETGRLLLDVDSIEPLIRALVEVGAYLEDTYQ
tara:strand:+ start:1847 stop:2086 length:240 start_codon:yes stop_codon:yes gene_type:complete